MNKPRAFNMQADMITYPYASDDPFENRKKYSYAKFHGAAFIEAWRKDRLMRCGESDTGLKPACTQNISKPDENSVIQTVDLLEFVYAELQSCTLEQISKSIWLAELVKKFEVTKRIHDAYKPGFSAVNIEDHKSLNLYIRLAQIFDVAYDRSQHLSYLNVMLKCMDTLCAVADQLSVTNQQHLTWLINKENEYISALITKNGLSV
jgi:methionyl-tRNA formyltransferase